MSVSPLEIYVGAQYTTTVYRRTGVQNATIVPIPMGFQARMTFKSKFGDPFTPLVLTSSPAAGLTIDYANGQIAVYIGATVTAAYPVGLALVWRLDIYDPLNADADIFLGSGDIVVKAF